mmetsp:Transcript_1628/g.6332  ORF Transcript_1628/g.6332 Transcript_1628/m.6332 type:complete len:409 (-) Transcript_1628:303-1529(-)
MPLMCMYPRLNCASSSPWFAAASNSRSAAASSRSIPLPSSRRYPTCLCASATPRAAMSSSISICSSPSSISCALTHPASLSRSRSRPGSRGSAKSPADSASPATSSAIFASILTAVSQSAPFSVSGGAPRPKSTRSAMAIDASRLPISAASARASRDHRDGEGDASGDAVATSRASFRPASVNAARTKSASAIGAQRAGVWVDPNPNPPAASTAALCAFIADRTASVMSLLASATNAAMGAGTSVGSPGFGSDPGKPTARAMARPTYPTPACSARSKSNVMFTLDASPGMRSRVRYAWVSSSSAAARPLKSAYASFTADLMASRAASRSRRASAASLSAPPTPRPVTSITSSMDGALDASSNMPTSAPSASRCSTPPRYRRRSSSSSRRLSSSPSSASSPSSSAASSV